MTKDKLVELKDAVEAKFNALAQEIKQAENDIIAKNTELTKLQGDFRTFEHLISNWDEPKPTDEPSDPVPEPEVTNG